LGRRLVLGLGGVGEVFVARVVAGGKVTIPLLVREVLKIEEGDYVRVSITEVIRKKQREGRKGRKKYDV
jgi:bifunctional DNA-binding transcriptional regulator/antitoxin component of YhaV-PrlF toxin-antitoxin module